jgi:biopolymer transport protein ExbD
MSSGGGASVASTPNVTPMIDVMLVLLIIFMVVTPALLAGFQADPPQAQNIKDHPEDDQTDQVLGIDKDGHYYLNKKQIRQEDVAAALKHIYVDTPRDDYIMYLKADKGLEYSKVMDAMEIAMKNGVKVVGMISDQKPGTISTVPGDTKQAAPLPVPGGAK